MDQTDLTALFCARPQAFAWFLGAGASRMSGLPTANDIIQDLKRRYFCQQEGEDISRQDMLNDAVRNRVQSFMDARGFPAQYADNEYTAYFEKIFGGDAPRQRAYLQGILSESRVTLTVGNRVVGALLAGGFSRLAFTTNFDSVVEKAFAEVSGRTLHAYHLEGPRAALQALNNEEFPIYCKLHGDFRYDSVKNLGDDLAKQDQELALCLTSAMTRFGLIVAGYSGRDESVMRLLNEALNQPNAFPAGLFWTQIKGVPTLPAVDNLIARANNRGVKAAIIGIETFDTLLLRLWRNIEGKPADMDRKVRKTAPATVNIPLLPPGTSRPLLRLNALPIRKLPDRCLVVRTKRALEWTDLRTLQNQADSRLIFTKQSEIWCWGGREDVKAVFGPHLIAIEDTKLPLDFKVPEHLHIKGFLEEALVAALARKRPLLSRTTRDGGILIVDRHATDQTLFEGIRRKVGRLSGTVAGLFAPISEEHPHPEQVSWAESLRVSLTQMNGQTWLVLDPDVWIWPPRARESATDVLDERRKGRFNNRYDELLSAWLEVLVGRPQSPTDITFSAFDGGNDAANPAFVVGSQTGFSWKTAP